MWLVSYPAGAAMPTSVGTAREVSVSGAALGPRRRLPRGYLIDQATTAGLLLAPELTRAGAARYLLWDGIRALDYLQGRPEVDGEKIAVTGISGGGAATFWIAAADDRVKVAVPVRSYDASTDSVLVELRFTLSSN